MSSKCGIECQKCNRNIASWMPFSPYHLNSEEINKEILDKYIKNYLDLINELKKISKAYRITYEDLIVLESFPSALSYDIKEQLEYYYSLFENVDDEEEEEEDNY